MQPVTRETFTALTRTHTNPTIEADDTFGLEYLMVDGATVACCVMEPHGVTL